VLLSALSLQLSDFRFPLDSLREKRKNSDEIKNLKNKTVKL